MEQMESLTEAVKQLTDNLQCPICFDTLTDPISTKCNHHFCSECFKKLFKSKGSQSCPMCHKSLTRRSYIKSTLSLNPIVNAVNELIKSLIDDTGIDFSKETNVRTSTKEAVITDDVHKQIANESKNDALLNQNKNKNSHKEVLKLETKKIKQYNRKSQPTKVEDSFLFPADFIAPKKNLIKKKESAESSKNKVSSWLTENENDFKEYDELSILNGSLPKKVPAVDLNVSSSEEELLSVSQMPPTSSTHLAPLKYKTDLIVINESPEKNLQCQVKQAEFKDPYEFISSQKSNEAKKIIKPVKRNTRSYGNKRKPLGLDISRLVNEPYMKKKESALGNTTFEDPGALNDTFDQLFLASKKNQFTLSSIKNTMTKAVESKKPKSSDKFLLFNSQSSHFDEDKLGSKVSDFSSGSDDNWTPNKKIVKRNIHRKSERVFKPKTTKSKATRKSDGILLRKKENDVMKEINKTFEEVENHKLVTSSQVAREEKLKPKENFSYIEKQMNEENCKQKVAKESDIEIEIIENYVPKEERNMSNEDNTKHTHSPGWSRVKHFKKDLNSASKLPVTNQSLTPGKEKKNITHSTNSINTSENLSADIVEIKVTSRKLNLKENYISPRRQLARPSEVNDIKDKQCSEESSVQTSQQILKDVSLSSPEEPVRYLNISQSEKRAEIMNNVWKSYESSLKEEEKMFQAAVSGQTEISVCVGNFPDEDECVVTDCIKKCTSRRALNAIKLDPPICKLNTPVSIIMSCETETSVESPNDIRVERDLKDQDTEGFITNNTSISVQKENEVPSTLQQEHNMQYAKNISLNHKAASPDAIQNIDAIRSQYSAQTSVEGSYCQKTSEENKQTTETSTVLTANDILDDKYYLSEKFREGSVPAKSVEECPADVEKKDSSALTKKEISKQVVRRVHFAEELNQKEMDGVHYSGSAGQCVSFFKMGSCSVTCHRARVKFWFLGSCVSKAERKSEISEWIFRISKTYPACFCGNNDMKSAKKADNVEEITSPLNKMKPSENKENKIIKKRKFDENVLQQNGFSQIQNNVQNFSSAKEEEMFQCTGTTISKEENDSKKHDINLLPSKLPKTLNSEHSPCKETELDSNNGSCGSHFTQSVKKSSGEDIFKSSECNELLESSEKKSVSLPHQQLPKSLNSEIVELDSNNGSQFAQSMKKSTGEDIFKSSECNELLESSEKKSVSLPHQQLPKSLNSEIVELDSNNGSQFTQSIKKSTGEDIFKSSESNKLFEPSENEMRKLVCQDLYKTNESDGIPPFQRPPEKILSEDIFRSEEGSTCEHKLQKRIEKISDENINQKHQNSEFCSKISSEETCKKFHVNTLQTCNAFSNDDDIFKSEEIQNVVLPLFHESSTSERKKENVCKNHTKSGGTSNNDNLKQEIETSEAEIENRARDAHVLGDEILRTHVNKMHTNKKILSKLEESARDQIIIDNKLIKDTTLTLEGSCTSSNQNTRNFVSQSDQNDEQFNKKVLRHKIPNHSSARHKRARPLSESSDDSDFDQVKRVQNVADKKPPANNSQMKDVHTTYRDLNIDQERNMQHSEVDDCKLNSEELLQRLINNINEDIGYNKCSEQVPKLKGAKKTISSDSEDDYSENIKSKRQKLSESPEHNVQGIMNIDDDVFDVDEVDNEEDVIESTPTKKQNENINSKRENSETIQLSRDGCVDGFENDGEESCLNKFVLPQCSPSSMKSYDVTKVLSTEEPKKSDKLPECLREKANKHVTSTKIKELTTACNLFGSPQTTTANSVGKSPLKTNNTKDVIGFQKSDEKIDKKKSSAVLNDNIQSQCRMVFACSGLTPRFAAVVKSFAQDIGAGFFDNFSMSITHLIVNVDENQATPKTVKYLQAVAAKKWVVSFNWVTACISAKKLLPEEDFEAMDTVGLDGPRRSRLSSESLFKNVQACFIEPFQNITVDKLQEIFMMCGGMVVDSPEGFSVINSGVIRVIIVDGDAEIEPALCQKWITRHRAVTLGNDWLVDCIGTYSLLPMPMWLASPFTREQLLACGIPEGLLDEDFCETSDASSLHGS